MRLRQEQAHGLDSQSAAAHGGTSCHKIQRPPTEAEAVPLLGVDVAREDVLERVLLKNECCRLPVTGLGVAQDHSLMRFNTESTGMSTTITGGFINKKYPFCKSLTGPVPLADVAHS